MGLIFYIYIFSVLFTSAIDRLLTVAGTQKQFKTLAVTELSRMHASVVLSTVYDDLISDKQREKFKEKCTNFLKSVHSARCSISLVILLIHVYVLIPVNGLVERNSPPFCTLFV